MSYLDKLLQGAPVEWKTLGEVAELERGKTITGKNKIDGNIPVISGGQKPAYYNANHNRKGETITIAGSGAYAGYVMYWNIPIFVSDAFSVKPNINILNTKYVYYLLLNSQNTIYNLKKGSGVPHVYPKDLATFSIPIPPLSVQEEIVCILDKFTALEAELEAELDCRKRQYEYYRDYLLTVNEQGLMNNQKVEWKTLGEVCDFKNGFAFKSNLFRESGLPIIRITNINNSDVSLIDIKYFNPSDYLNNSFETYKVKKGDILIAMSGATTGKIGYYNLDKTAYLNQRVGKFIPNKAILNNRFLYHFLLTKMDYIYVLAGGGAQPNLSSNILKEKLRIPIPPIEEQERIVAILDKFDTLAHSISEGLPKEIELRKKQYEYYRDQLLSFSKNEIN
ncbi:restriction endonuclease subunit S [Riemerella anatipestifer]|uniref:restriction endonuclease subunit S n=1 Tax=Riemerella anatipestifer TaxID=34085 RepID=UPI0030BE11BE